jgi:putative Mg2+ transporter-C (MgtC) family protein
MPVWEVVLRLTVATALGAVLGSEREARLRPAGTRDLALVALGAALFTIAGIIGFGGGTTSDPARIAAQVVTGIGFIGAGAILRTGLSVRGITTAATLWVAAAVGLAVGCGLYVEAVTAAALTLVVLIVLQLVGRRLQRPHRRLVRVEYERGAGTLGPVVRDLEAISVYPVRIHIKDENAIRVATLEVTTRDQEGLDRILVGILQRPEVREAGLEGDEGT